MMSSPSLLGLPTELRLKIYHEVFESWEINIHARPVKSCWRWTGVTHPQWTSMGLLFICRKIYEESTLSCYHNATFVIRKCGCWAYTSSDSPVGASLERSLRSMRNLRIQGLERLDMYNTLERLSRGYASPYATFNHLEIDTTDAILSIGGDSKLTIR